MTRTSMKIYLVGGAVRDQLLSLPQKEKDWVVVGATVDDMLRQGFRQVGKDFPVFLHPKTQEEYALARQERKIGRGYTGFDFDTSSTVTLEDDLKRRDLTINAIAETPDGEFVDPYGGRQDIQQRILRHVSPAFVEDPVRILRVARFLARFKYLGFCVAEETLQLMQQMVLSGEIDALVAERVWKEWERALKEKNPEEFFLVLQKIGALKKLFPVLNDAAIHALAVAGKQTEDSIVRFAVLCHVLTVDAVKALCERYRIPIEYRDVALLMVRFAKTASDIKKLSAAKIVDLLQALDAFRRTQRFEKFLLASEICYADFSKEKWQKFFTEARAINPQDVILRYNVTGKALADKIREERITRIEGRN